MALTVVPPAYSDPGSGPAARSDLISVLGPPKVGVSATLAANEAMDARRRRGEPVLPLAFGEAGLPAHRTLRAALARASRSSG